MRILLILMFLILQVFSLQAQTTVQSIEAAEAASVSIPEIEEKYGDAIHADPKLAVFNGQENEFIKSYRQLITDISSHLTSNGFIFDGDTRMFTRIYFNSDGTIDHFYYNSAQAKFTSEKEQQFDQILTPFLSNYSFSKTADEPFAQCSPVVFASGK